MYGPSYGEPVPRMVSSWTKGWGTVDEGPWAAAPSSAAYEVGDRGVWQPVYVPSVAVARRVWWANGASVAGNVEAGIYRDAGYKPGALLVTSGSVAQATVSVVQFADITDTTLSPGLYWLYLSCSSGSATFFRSTTATAAWDELTRFQQDSIAPGSAPATATPAESNNTNFYLFGFATTASP